ncbi:hypothetical protein C7974DRAFT_318663, partial [Boeremia exigua]|uniref:uncharacterized protein n=1 Tax=Boeremia exigua TaxID=749465 RepID=UPI001E8E1199
VSVLDFLCDIRFHKSYVLPPNLDTGRHAPYRVSYADYGDPDSNAVVLFCGALMGTRFCYSLLDQMAKEYKVRIIHPDRPGIGGSQSVDLDKRIQTWLEMVPLLLAHLNITHVSLASHSGGDVYLLNTLLTYPYLLHPGTPYVCFFAPWVHHSNSKISQLRAAELLPAPLLGKFVSVVRFVNDNATPLAGLGGNFMQGIRYSMHRCNSNPGPEPALAPIPLTPACLAMRTRGTSLLSHDSPAELSLDDDAVVEELRSHIASFLFAECMDGISADVQLFLRKPHSIAWCSSVYWSDFDYAVPLISKMISEEDDIDGLGRAWTIDTFHAQTDAMVGEKGKVWFDSCWMTHQSTLAPIEKVDQCSSYLPLRNAYQYRSQVVEGAEHNYLMDPAFGASGIWLQRVRDAFPDPVEVRSPVVNHQMTLTRC